MSSKKERHLDRAKLVLNGFSFRMKRLCDGARRPFGHLSIKARLCIQAHMERCFQHKAVNS